MMRRVTITFGTALVVGAVVAGGLVLRHQTNADAADAEMELALADSIAALDLMADSLAGAVPGLEEDAEPEADAHNIGDPTSQDSTAVVLTAGAVQLADAVAASADGGAPVLESAGDGTPRMSQDRLVRILDAMKPAEAARILAELNDSEAAALLAALPERKAALIMGGMNPTRAAAIWRVAMRGERNEP